MDALCVRCRAPLTQDALCPSCDADEAAVAAKIRKLRDEIAQERGQRPPAKPRSRLWSEKQEKLAAAKKQQEEAGSPGSTEKGAPRGTDPSDRKGASQATTPPPGSRKKKRRDRSSSRPAKDGSAGDAPPKKSDPHVPPAVTGGDRPSGSTAPETAPEAPEPGPGTERQPAKVYRAGVSASGIRARELDVTDPRHGTDAVQELLEHRRKGLGKIIGIAGLPRHGKTKLADRLRERYAERPGADLRYDKTERGEVNLYYLPGRREHHVLIDVAGEDFQTLGDYERDLPALMRQFLWPVLQELDGLILLQALPIVWAGWNDPHGKRRAEPSERDEIAMRQARDRMVNAHRMLLKYAVVAQDLRRLKKAVPGTELSSTEVPTRNQVDDAVPSAAKLRAPVAVAFSKADLFAPGDSLGSAGVAKAGRTEATSLRRTGLFTPDLPGRPGQPAPPLHPRHTDPVALGYLHFPELFEFLTRRVRFFTFDFVQALVDRSERPDPQEATEAESDAGRETLLGGEGLLEFVTKHPWGAPGMDTERAIRWDQKLHSRRWEAELLRRLHDRVPEDRP